MNTTRSGTGMSGWVSLSRRRRGAAGFTLIELLVVVVILGILAAVVVFAVRGSGDKGRGAAIASDERAIRTAEEAYCATKDRYADMGTAAEPGTLVGDKYLSEPSTLHTATAKQPGPCHGWSYEISSTPAGSSTTGSQLSPPSILAGGEYHSLAVKKDGTPSAWGANDHGQLGNGTTAASTPSIALQTASGLSDVTATSAAYRHSLALKKDGTVWAWGDNSYGQLGNGNKDDSPTPAQVPNLDGVTAVAAGIYHSLALKGDGTVWVWGWDYVNPVRTIPVRVSGLSDISAIAANGHSLALDRDGTVWAWGPNYRGELGDGTLTDSPVPVHVKDLRNITAIVAGGNYSLALKSDGTVWGWGDNYYGQLGFENPGSYDGSGYTTPVQMRVPATTQTASTTVPVVGGTLPTTSTTPTVTLPYGDGGYLPTPTTKPPDTVPFGDVAAIAGNGGHTLALKRDGTLWAWGNNDHGQLGRGTVNSSYDDQTAHIIFNPVARVSATGVFTAIAAGIDHALARKADGTVWSWGRNYEGQLGRPYNPEPRCSCTGTPAAVTGLVM